MDHNIVKRYWEDNANLWIYSSDHGHDEWRNCINTPAFLNVLPEVSHLCGLDIGCGDGYNSRLLANRCRSLLATDICESFVNHNKSLVNPDKLTFEVANAADLPYQNETFDFATSFLALMDIAETDLVLKETGRVLKQGGFFQFSILHPCFDLSKGKFQADDEGNKIGFLMRDYFKESNGEIDSWAHKSLKGKNQEFKIPRFNMPLNKWVKCIIKNGFVIEALEEPRASDEQIKENEKFKQTRVVPQILIVRCRKT